MTRPRPARIVGPFLALAAVLLTATSVGAQILQVGRLDANLPSAERGFVQPGGTAPLPSSNARVQADPRASGGAPALDPDGDFDGDGLTNGEEADGWDIVIDENGYGTEALGTLLTIRHVTSDPRAADGDFDGLDDLEEWAIGSDPLDVDTDGDLLDDEVEWKTWFTSPNSVDSDGDARGPDGDAAPNVSLFDGYELDDGTPRTSPTLDDTDGDGRTDYEEFDHPFFSPLLAELPTAAVVPAGELDVRLDIEYAESVVQEVAYENSFSLGTTATQGAESSSNYSDTHGWSTEVSFSYQQGAQASAVPPSLTATGSATQEFSAGYHGETTKEYGFTVSSETARSAEKTSSQYRSDSQEYTETAASGSVTLPIRIRNDGGFAYTLTNLGITLMAFEPDPTDQSAGVYRSMGTITPDLESVTLAPGEETPILNLDSGDLNADVVKSFLANPSTLVLQPSIFDMQDADGVDFDFITEHTFSQTALVEIDYGNGTVDSWRVATNVDREGFEYQGVRLSYVLNHVLGLDWTAKTWKDEDGNSVTGEDIHGNSTTIKVLTKVEDVASEYEEDGSSVGAFWSVATDADLDHAMTAEVDGQTIVHFASIHLFAGDSIRIIHDRDDDGDGLWASKERDLGTSDQDADSDGDGVDDWKEAIKGWQVPAGSGHFVYSDPRNEDTDFDGLTDEQELDARTDPQDPDTDGDGLPDGEDPAPTAAGRRLHVRVSPPGQNGDGSSWSEAMTLLDAVEEAQAANTNVSIEDDVIAIWLAEGAYDLEDQQLHIPIGSVSVYGGFQVGDLKLGDRNPDPVTNLTTITSSGSGEQVIRFDIEGQGNNATPAGTLDGLTIMGVTGFKRVIRVEQGVATLRNLLVVGNQTKFGAVGMFNNGSVQASNVEFLQNASENNGGAVYDGGKRPSRWQDCRFSLNDAQSKGGAVYREVPVSPGTTQQKPTFERCTFFGNQVYSTATTVAGLGGGAVSTDDGGTFIGCDFFGNQTGSAKDSTNFKWGKNALKGGAIKYDAKTSGYDSDLTLINCRFFDNQSGLGGAVFVNDLEDGTVKHTLNVVNCTLARNTALLLGDGTLPIAVQGSGGLHVEAAGSEPGAIALRNTILTDNVSFGFAKASQLDDDVKRRANIIIRDISPFVVDIAFTTIGGVFDDVNGFYTGNANNDEAPGFISQVAGNLRLESTSAMIDQGVNAVDVDVTELGFQPLPLTDIDGDWRIVEGDGYGVPTVDRGAYEYQP